jgi:shikimate kinase
MSFVLMTVGKTHSGKTTFGRELAQQLGPCCLLDSNEVADFLKRTYSDLYQADYEEGSNQPTRGYYLKLAVVAEIYKAALSTNLPIIFTTSNAKKQLRQEICRLAKESGRSTIMVYFNIADEVLVERINNSQRLGGNQAEIQGFNHFLTNIQTHRFEVPIAAEADHYFEINRGSNKQVLEQVLKVMRPPVND